MIGYLTRFGRRKVRPELFAAGHGVRIALCTLATLPRVGRSLRSTLDQMYLSGIKSLAVVLFVGFFTGMIISLQTGHELARYGQEEAIGLLVPVLMCREMGPFITAVILAAGVASALAAELGTMVVQEEVTALEVLSIDVPRYLLLPRILGLVLVAPILTLLSDFVGILGGAVIAIQQLNMDFQLYTTNAFQVLQIRGETIPLPKDIYTGLAKSVVFGFTIAVVGCSCGLRATGGARGVGEATRSAVRTSIILIILFNFFLGKLFYQ